MLPFFFFYQICQISIVLTLYPGWGFSGGSVVKNLPASVGDVSLSLIWEDSLKMGVAPVPVFLPGKSHGQGTLVGYSPWGHRV